MMGLKKYTINLRKKKDAFEKGANKMSLQTGLFWKKQKKRNFISYGQPHLSKIGDNCQGVQI